MFVRFREREMWSPSPVLYSHQISIVPQSVTQIKIELSNNLLGECFAPIGQSQLRLRCSLWKCIYATVFSVPGCFL